MPVGKRLPSCLQGGNTVRQLLKLAQKTVPEEEWKQTPVVLKATAGLRLLPEDKANALLDEVRHVLSPATDSLAEAPPVQETAKCLQVCLRKKGQPTHLVAVM